MSAQEERQAIIKENLPKLIGSVTKLQPNDENFKLCEQFAWYTIKNHRNLSVNSHEIKRKIDGMLEKFIIGNYPKHAKYLEKLYTDLINNPLCINHYEIDVHWALLDFLLDLAYNPVGAVRKSKIVISNIDEQESVSMNVKYWANLLKEDFILVSDQLSEDSELSEWSDSENDSHDENYKKNQSLDKTGLGGECFKGMNLKPPMKTSHFDLFNGSKSKNFLFNEVQNSWWQENNSSQENISSHDEANFCKLWNSTNNLTKENEISTVSEYCLLREIIWMFQIPCDCKFFHVEHNNVFVKTNVSIPSVSVHGLKYFLQKFTPYMSMISVLKNFISSIYNCSENIIPPQTYECYATGLEQLLQPFYEVIIKLEKDIKEQLPGEIMTVIQLWEILKNHLKYIENLHKIHLFVILDYKNVPSHISSAHLLAGLLSCVRNSGCPEFINLAISLFFASIKSFCHIVDKWWTEGRLDDWHNEYLIEKSSNGQEISSRPFSKCKEKSFFVSYNVSKIIQEDDFLKLLMNHSLEAGCTLNFLYQIDKIGELKNAGNFQDNLYDTFINTFLNDIKNFNIDENPINESPIVEDISISSNEKGNTFFNQISRFADEFLVMAFTCDTNILNNELEIENVSNESDKNILRIFSTLNRSSTLILPSEEIIMKSISKILQSRISFANNFVMRLYKKEFYIANHLQNIRKVLLLEASDLMHVFYTKLFTQIELGKLWANQFLLTVQLDNIFCTKFPDMSSLFRIEILSNYNNESTKVTDAVDQISIRYDVRNELKNIINEKIIGEYNKVFRFLLKVKWGLWSLENLQFSRLNRKRLPYIELKVIDLFMRRLEQLRFWMIYDIECIHFHLMTHVLQLMGIQLDAEIANCQNLIEMKSIHSSYISTICDYCFLNENGHDIKFGVEQLLNLVYVLRFEWHSCIKELEDNLNVHVKSNCHGDGEHNNIYINSSQIEAIENTFIRCHQYLAKTLNNEVYSKQNIYLSGLSAAFNGSIPY